LAKAEQLFFVFTRQVATYY